jgi:hypothetical protein
MALIGVLALVQGGEQRVENTVVALENFIQEHNIGLGNLTGGLYHRLPLVQGSYGGAVGFQLLRRLSDELKGCGSVLLLTVHRTFQIEAKIMIDTILL